MVKSLNNKWKELLFAFSGFGPNFLMVLLGAFFTDAVNPVALGATAEYQAIASGVCFILPALFPILYAIAKAFDGIIDVPFAWVSDNLKTRWGRRRPPIAICLIPMIVSYGMLWWPIAGASGQVANTIWIMFWSLVFFSTYTMAMIAFYGSMSTTCCDDGQRTRVSGYKSFFDTISYCLVYALVPVILSSCKINIDKFALCAIPLMLTLVIPLFLIKEGEKYGYPENQGLKPEKLNLWKSFGITFKNKPFLSWVIVNACAFFGLQMFLTSMNALIVGGMGFNGLEMALINSCAFAPVPIMLYFFNKVRAKKGFRFTFQTCLIAFAIAILSFFFASTFMTGGNKIVQYIIACIGGVIGSWAIGAFFMASYLVPAQVSGAEEKLLGRNHSAMYFAVQAITTSVVGAISSGLIYENIKMLFISKEAGGVVWAENITKAATKFGVAESSVFNLGTLLVPIIVSVMCVIGFIIAFKMPKDYNPAVMAKELKKQNPDLDISAYENQGQTKEKGEIVFVQIALSILSGFIFGFIWLGYLLRDLKKMKVVKNAWLEWILNCFVPFYSIYFAIKTRKQLVIAHQAAGTKPYAPGVLSIIFGIIFPIMPINVVNLGILQKNANILLEANYDDKVSASIS